MLTARFANTSCNLLIAKPFLNPMAVRLLLMYVLTPDFPASGSSTSHRMVPDLLCKVDHRK